MNSQEMVVRNQFTNSKSPGHANVKAFVMNYMLRDQAVEPLVVSSEQQAKYIQTLTRLKSPEDQDAVGILNHKLKFSGVGFDLDNPALSHEEALTRANECQAAYDRGGTVKQTVLSFDADWLIEHGLLSEDVEQPIARGDLHGKLDQRRFREAVQDGLKAMFEQTTMHNPQIVGAVQTDTANVHVHLSIWDQDPKVKDDRGMINATQKQALRDGFEYSVDHNPRYLNETTNLANIADLTQKNAKFKRAVLEDELYKSALRLDKPSLDEYVNNLAAFDQRTLSERQRESLEERIRHDWVAQGRRETRSHTLTQGQRRGRRQIRAMRRATQLRQDLRGYDDAAKAGQTVASSEPVRASMVYEYKRQLGIVEKYRGFQRPRVNALYQARKPELDARREALLERRNELLPALGVTPIRDNYIRRLLDRPEVMQGLASDFRGPVTQSPAYQELRKAQADPYFPLSDSTIKSATKGLDNAESEIVTENLTKNRKIEPSGLLPQQRFWLAQYTEDLSDYEMDAASWGGLSVQDVHLMGFNPDTGELNLPPMTSSIYDRELMRNEPDILALDAHEVLDAGPLKPEIELAMRRELTDRAQALLAAHDYFEKTGQRDPDWLEYAQLDLNRGYDLVDGVQSDVVQEKPTPTVEITGYELGPDTRRELVNKHLQDMSALER